VGPNAQHAFFQLLHQGTEAVTCDFIMPARRYLEKRHNDAATELAAQHELALANCLAQSRLLALGDAALENAESMSADKRYRGNQPSSTLLLDELTPRSMGALIALYEHKVFVQSVIWDINPFDQWGVEMGKKIAVDTLARLRGEACGETDGSTAGLVERILGG
jgi:glucose-6-phosphate isomerase